MIVGSKGEGGGGGVRRFTSTPARGAISIVYTPDMLVGGVYTSPA